MNYEKTEPKYLGNAEIGAYARGQNTAPQRHEHEDSGLDAIVQEAIASGSKGLQDVLKGMAELKVSENGGKYTVSMDLGEKPSANFAYANGHLVLTQQGRIGSKAYSFVVAQYLPGADASKAKATYSKGKLTLEMPRSGYASKAPKPGAYSVH